MLKIFGRKNKEEDSRNTQNETPEKVEKYDYELEIHKHVCKVRENINNVVKKLELRAWVHDASKFLEDEYETFERVSPRLRESTYGSPEYKDLLKELGSVEEPFSPLGLHYKRNDHHPEHFMVYTCTHCAHKFKEKPDVCGICFGDQFKHVVDISQMDIFQLVEMLCDWKAACEKHDNGDIMESLKINRERFLISDQLYNIMVNTYKRWDD